MTASFCGLAYSVGVCCRNHHGYFATSPLSNFTLSSARSLVSASPSLSKEAARTCYGAATMLTMGAGYERSRNKVDGEMVR